MVDFFQAVAQAFWIVAPAYAANAFPPLVGGKRPLDFGKRLGKNRIFGDGKTWEGTFFGIVFGVFFGILQIVVQSRSDVPTEFSFLMKMNLTLVVLIAVGAIIGDIIGAFIKRRLGIPRGAPLLPLDQLDFLMGAIVFASFVTTMWLESIIFLFIVTPLIHWLANLIGYRYRVKREPW